MITLFSLHLNACEYLFCDEFRENWLSGPESAKMSLSQGNQRADRTDRGLYADTDQLSYFMYKELPSKMPKVNFSIKFDVQDDSNTKLVGRATILLFGQSEK